MKPTICRACGGLIDHHLKGRWSNVNTCHHCDNLPQEEPADVIPETSQPTSAQVGGSHSSQNRPGLSHIVL